MSKCELCGVELTVAKAVSIFGVEEVGRFEHDTTEHTSARCAKLLAEKLRAAETRVESLKKAMGEAHDRLDSICCGCCGSDSIAGDAQEILRSSFASLSTTEPGGEGE